MYKYPRVPTHLGTVQKVPVLVLWVPAIQKTTKLLFKRQIYAHHCEHRAEKER
jgi:hypothetical protein